MILASASPLGLCLGLAAAGAYALVALAKARLSSAAVQRALLLAWVLHGALLGLTLVVEPARFGFAPALSVTVWLALTVYGIESRVYPQLGARWELAALGALAVGLALWFPGAPLHTQASAWLPLHWALGIASYGLFAAAVVHAWLMGRAEKQMRQATPDQVSAMPLLTLERLTFRFVLAGFILLSATLVAAWLFGEQLYGAAGVRWRWDHKTIFSVLAWLAFAALLLGRSRFGWRGRGAVRVLYMGAGLLLLAYAGSRFVMEVLLGRGG